MTFRRVRALPVVWCVALLLATTGTSYAAVQLAKGSVTTKVLAKNAVKSAKIKDGSVKARDVATGVVPGEAQTWVGQRDGFTPVSAPESHPDADRYLVSLPRSGTVVVSYFASRFQASCTAGVPVLGLYVDDEPVTGTGIYAQGDTPEPVSTSGTVELGAGPHDFAIGVDCPNGNFAVMSMASSMWTTSMLARGHGS